MKILWYVYVVCDKNIGLWDECYIVNHTIEKKRYAEEIQDSKKVNEL